jgi:CheY-like chemotaxis protein
MADSCGRIVRFNMTRILVVDDHDDTRELLATLFESAGYEVVVAADGLEAVTMARAYTPAVILMDLYMPKMDGVEATRRIKASTQLGDIPIVAYTARPPGPMRDDNLFAAICQKPCPPDVLMQVVKRAVTRTPGAPSPTWIQH